MCANAAMFAHDCASRCRRHPGADAPSLLCLFAVKPGFSSFILLLLRLPPPWLVAPLPTRGQNCTKHQKRRCCWAELLHGGDTRDGLRHPLPQTPRSPGPPRTCARNLGHNDRKRVSPLLLLSLNATTVPPRAVPPNCPHSGHRVQN